MGKLGGHAMDVLEQGPKQNLLPASPKQWELCGVCASEEEEMGESNECGECGTMVKGKTKFCVRERARNQPRF